MDKCKNKVHSSGSIQLSFLKSAVVYTVLWGGLYYMVNDIPIARDIIGSFCLFLAIIGTLVFLCIPFLNEN